METEGQDEVPRIQAPSQRARRKRTKWPKPSGGRKAPASATEKHFFLMWEEPPSARREEAESSLTRTPGENVLLPKSYHGAPPGLDKHATLDHWVLSSSPMLGVKNTYIHTYSSMGYCHISLRMTKIKFKKDFSVYQKTILIEYIFQSQHGRRYLQYRSLKKNSFPEHTKNQTEIVKSHRKSQTIQQKSGQKIRVSNSLKSISRRPKHR